jgi:hypothetical protein
MSIGVAVLRQGTGARPASRGESRTTAGQRGSGHARYEQSTKSTQAPHSASAYPRPWIVITSDGGAGDG